jgi:hypothetical protein
VDPVSWLQIEQGWRVVGSDGGLVGIVAQIEGDMQADVFDGLAISPASGDVIRYVPGEQVGAIYPGEVNLKIAVPDAHALQAFEAPPPEIAWVPGKASLGRRLGARLRGTGGAEGIDAKPIVPSGAPTRQGWFGPKRGGYGRRPMSWQGWAIAIVLTIVVIVVAIRH